MPKASTPADPKASRNVYAFGATSFFNDTASEMAYWVLPAFLASLGAGPAQIGLIEGIAESVVSFAKLFSGYLADRLARRKPIIVGGYFVANAVKPLLALATSWGQVLVIRFADRLSKGLRGATRDVMLAESVDPAQVGSAFGLLQAMDSAGAIAGPLLALWILAHYSMRGVFWAAVVPGFLSIAVAAITIRETKKTAPAKLASTAAADRLDRSALVRDGVSISKGNPWRPGLPASFYYVLFVAALFSLGNSSDMFLVLRAQNLGIPAAHAPLLGLVFNLTYTLLSWPAGRLSDRFSRRRLAAAGYFVFAVVYFVFAAAPSLTAIWVSMAGYGLFYALTSPVLRALVASTVPAEVRGRAFGIFFFVTSVATLLASILTGQLWQHCGPRFPFYASAGLALVAALLLLIPHKPAPLSS